MSSLPLDRMYNIRYPNAPEVRVVDSALPTIRRKRARDRWVAARNAVLRQWEPTDLRFVLEEGEPGGPWVSPTTPENLERYYSKFIPGAIRFISAKNVTRTVDGKVYPYAWASVEWQGPVAPAGIVWMHPSQYRHGNRVWAAHELGHCLGLGHGGTGVMGNRWPVSDEEVRLVREFYFEEVT